MFKIKDGLYNLGWASSSFLSAAIFVGVSNYDSSDLLTEGRSLTGTTEVFHETSLHSEKLPIPGKRLPDLVFPDENAWLREDDLRISGLPGTEIEFYLQGTRKSYFQKGFSRVQYHRIMLNSSPKDSRQSKKTKE